MTTTSKYLKVKEYFKLTEGGVSSREQTNPRYKNFKQVNYTAGDEEQFLQHLIRESGEVSNIELDGNMWESNLAGSLPKSRISSRTVMANFKYYFHCLKKGIFVKIRNNKLEVFLPFSKSNFTNSWGEKIEMTDSEILGVYESSQTRMNRRFNPHRINRNKNQWIGNNFLIRNEFPQIEGDSNVSCLKHMLETLCESRKVPDTEFFLNRRDFPLLRQDFRHPYTPLVAGNEKVFDDTKGILPIFSMCAHENFIDSGIPTWDDWARIAFQDRGIKFNTSYLNRLQKDYGKIPEQDWDAKIDKVIFRGSSTGEGVTIDTNPRLKVCSIQDDRLDVGITSWNLRPRAQPTVTRGTGPARRGVGFVLHTISEDVQNSIGLKEPLDSVEQSGYKYILHIPGHSCAFRLSMELGMNVVVLLVKSPYTLWFHRFLIEGTHYLHVESDLSNLSEVMDWCWTNPVKCKKIAENAKTFYDTYLSQNGVLDYWQKILIDSESKTGVYKYNVISARDVGSRMEMKLVSRSKCAKISSRKKKQLVSASDWKIIWESKTTLVQHSESLEVVRKIVKDSKLEEFIHEIFIGACIIPEMKYSDQYSELVYFDIKEKVSYWKFVEGISLAEYLKTSDFNITGLLDILVQICGILEIGLEEFEFCHNDIFPWNIMLTPCSKPRSYFTKHGVWRSQGPYKVVLLDFGKSHVVYKNIHRGLIKPYTTSTIQDIIILLVSVSSGLLAQHCESRTLTFIFDLMQFLSREPKYCPQFRTAGHIRKFTRKARKYTEIIYSDKHTLESLRPVDLIKHLGIRIEDKRIPSPRNGNHPRVYPTDDCFDDPYSFLELVKRIGEFGSVESNTLKTIGKIVHGLNAKKLGDQIYTEIASCLNK
jgi:hypothetical protein